MDLSLTNCNSVTIEGADEFISKLKSMKKTVDTQFYYDAHTEITPKHITISSKVFTHEQLEFIVDMFFDYNLDKVVSKVKRNKSEPDHSLTIRRFQGLTKAFNKDGNTYMCGPLSFTLPDAIDMEDLRHPRLKFELDAKDPEIRLVGKDIHTLQEEYGEKPQSELLSRLHYDELLRNDVDTEFAQLVQYGPKTAFVALGYENAVSFPDLGCTEFPSYPIEVFTQGEGRSSQNIVYNTNNITKSEVKSYYDSSKSHSSASEGEFFGFPDAAIKYFTESPSRGKTAKIGTYHIAIAYLDGKLTQDEAEALEFTPFAIGEPYLMDVLPEAKKMYTDVQKAYSEANLSLPGDSKFVSRDEISEDSVKRHQT